MQHSCFKTGYSWHFHLLWESAGSSWDGHYKLWDLPLVSKNTQSCWSQLLCWLDLKRESSIVDLENSDSAVSWFSAWLCPIYGFASHIPYLSLICSRSTASWSHQFGSDFGKHTNTNQPTQTRRWIGGGPSLSPGCSLRFGKTKPEGSMSIGIQCTERVSWSMLSKEERKICEKTKK